MRCSTPFSRDCLFLHCETGPAVPCVALFLTEVARQGLGLGQFPSQEFRIVKQSRILKDVLDEILRACERAETVPEAELGEKLQDVQEYYTDLAESNQARKDNVSFILGAEQEHFQKFRKLYDDVDWERKTSGVLSGCGAAAGLAVGLAAACPVTLFGAALFTAISAVATAEHR